MFKTNILLYFIIIIHQITIKFDFDIDFIKIGEINDVSIEIPINLVFLNQNTIQYQWMKI